MGGALKGLFYRNFLTLELEFLGNCISTFRVTQEVTQVSIDGCRYLPIVSEHGLWTNSSPIHPYFQCFGPNAVPPRSLPIVPDHRKLVGPLGLD